MFQYLDLVIGFVVLMLVASLFITAATQVVVSLLGLRGANLRRSLVDLFEAACPGQEVKPWAKEVARRVLRHPTISDSIFSRFALHVDQVPFAPPETAGKLQGISGAIPLLPWIMGAIGGSFVTATAVAVAKHWFADICQYADHLAGYVSVLNFCQHPWRTGAILGAILGGLLSRWRLATSIHVEELPAILEQLAAPLPGTLPDPAQRAMLILAWTRYEPGASPRPGAGVALPQEVGPVRSKAFFDESLVRRASAAAVHGEYHSAAEDFDEGIVRHAGPIETEASVAVATESATAPAKELDPEIAPATRISTPVSTPSEPRMEGLRAWFDHVMERASQRFTVQTRLITVVLSCVFVFAWHFDAVQLLRSMSRGVELRAQLAAAAAGIDKQAEQLPRSKQGAHTVVPEVYRQAMVSVLRTASTETSANNEGTEGKSSAKRRGRAKEREKDAATAAPGVDRVTAEAKSKAIHDLETVPGFASREEAESWLRTTLDGNPARAILAVAYRQEVNAELVNDSDRFIDQSASLTSELARSEIKLFQDERPAPLSRTEVPGLLVTIAFLSLGAAFWYNTLKNLASLRPPMAIRQARAHKL